MRDLVISRPEDEYALLLSVIVTIVLLVTNGIFVILCLSSERSQNDEARGNEHEKLINDGDPVKKYQADGSTHGTDVSSNISHTSHQESDSPNVTSGTCTNNIENSQTPRSHSQSQSGPPKQSPRVTTTQPDTPRPPSPKTMRNIEREKQIQSEADIMMELSREMFQCKSVESLPDLGSRLQKLWFKADTGNPQYLELLAVVKISKQCQLDLDNPEVLNVMRRLFNLIRHPCLQAIDIDCKEDYVGILQPFVSEGSIRDCLFQASPYNDWCDKYITDGKINLFPKKDIFKCGYQVLKAVEVLYDLGFHHIGQIHSGNVFVCKGDYFLGGYENSVLGYRSSMYQQINENGLLDQIDVVMFGHLLYEMCAKQSLKTVLPTDTDYSHIEDSELRNLIKFIFQTATQTQRDSKTAKGSQKDRELMKKISCHECFKYHNDSHPLDIIPIELPPDVTTLLDDVFPRELNLKEIAKKLHKKYTDVELLPKMGWRFGKIWASARCIKSDVLGLLTAIAVPNACPIFVKGSMKDIKKLMFLEHNYIFKIGDIDLVTIDRQQVIVIFQDMVKNGSLRDTIYQIVDQNSGASSKEKSSYLASPPRSAWASKYKSKSMKTSSEDIFKWGAQILQAMYFLSHLESSDESLTLGFVHTGNIFVQDDVCRLGGFENAILGHQTGRHYMFEDCDSCDNINVLIFGHVIFELSTGKEAMTVYLTEKEYEDVPKNLHPILKRIFNEENFTMEEIMKVFGCTPTLPKLPKLSSDAKYLLQKVRKGKARDQSSLPRRGKYFFQSKLHKAKNKFRRTN